VTVRDRLTESFPHLQHSDEIQRVQPPPDDQRRDHGSGDDPETRPRDGLARDEQWEALYLALNGLHDERRQTVAEEDPARQRRQREQRELAQEDQRNLRSCEAEHTQARQLAAAL
jgi:hypothetical protein